MTSPLRHTFSPGDVAIIGRYRTAESYRYGFQGQEQDSEMWQGAASFKYRIEDARLGRFFSVDPLHSKYPYWSDYSFSGNILIHAREFEGLEAVIGVSLGGDVEYRKAHLQALNEEAIVKSIYEPVLPNDPSEIQSFIELLKSATTSDPSGSIGFISIWGHGNGYTMWGRNTESTKNPVGSISFDELNELRTAMATGEICFSEGAVIFLSSCNSGTEFELPNNELEFEMNNSFCGLLVVDEFELNSIAQELADIAGIKVIAAKDEDSSDGTFAGGVSPKNETKGVEMQYQVRVHKGASFYSFEKGKDPVSVGDTIKLSDYAKSSKLTQETDKTGNNE